MSVFQYLFFLPLGTCAVLGLIVLFDPDVAPLFRGGLVVAVGLGVWLQFFSSFRLAGLLVLVVLAVVLAIWLRLQHATWR